ncbi:heparinase II/III family protein, partial [Opitutaceae bacterium]|nr:heparinase II/III family protein [Opitutaceae bacterium]
MKIVHRITICLTMAILAAAPLPAGKDFMGANWKSYSGFQVGTKAVLPKNETHPSLWFSKEGLTDFKKLLHKDATIEAYWDKVRNHPLLTTPFPEVIPEDQIWIPELASANNKRIHKYYGEMTQIPLYAGFMAWMTDDPTQKQKYIDRAKAALLRAFDGPIFDLDPTKSGVDKSVDEIYRGIWSQSICGAYDFVQPFLTEKEDLAIRERLIKEARYTHENLNSWASGPHNHLSKPAWGLAAFALALSDEPEAKNWFRKAMKAANQNTHYHFSSDGIYREGTMYYVFSWLNFVPFLYHYKNVSGVDYFEDFKEAFEWGVIGRNARGWTMNVEDSFIRPVPTQMVAKAFRDHRSFLAPYVPFSEVLQWNFQNTDYQPFRDVEKISGFNYTGATWDYPKELYELITYDPKIKATAPTADPTIFMEGGQTFFRNSWLNQPDEQFYLLFHSVPQADNHDHHDTLSYILYAKNQMMASDSGYTRSSYGEDIRYTYYRRPQAHNTITFDDIPLGDYIENQPNPSEDKLNTSFFDFEKKSAPFRRYLGDEMGSAKRSIAFIQDEYFLVLDEVKGQVYNGQKLEGKFDVYFHGGRSDLNIEDGNYTWSYEKDRYGDDSKLLTRQLAPNSEIEVLETESTYIKADYASFPSLRTTKAGHEALFGQIMYPLSKDQEPPIIEDFSSDKLLAARIEREGITDIFLKSHTEKKSDKLGLQIDGDFAWIRLESENITQVAGQSAKRIAHDGMPIVTSNQRVSFALKMGPESELGVDIESPTELTLHRAGTISSIELDGESIPLESE